MNIDELQHRLLSDLRTLGLPVDEVGIYFRPYSKTYYGRYYPVQDVLSGDKPKLYLYPFSDKENNLLPYDIILSSAIHEMVHHEQYNDRDFIRNVGVMHNPDFWEKYNSYIKIAVEKGILTGEKVTE